MSNRLRSQFTVLSSWTCSVGPYLITVSGAGNCPMLDVSWTKGTRLYACAPGPLDADYLKQHLTRDNLDRLAQAVESGAYVLGQRWNQVFQRSIEPSWEAKAEPRKHQYGHFDSQLRVAADC